MSASEYKGMGVAMDGIRARGVPTLPGRGEAGCPLQRAIHGIEELSWRHLFGGLSRSYDLLRRRRWLTCASIGLVRRSGQSTINCIQNLPRRHFGHDVASSIIAQRRASYTAKETCGVRSAMSVGPSSELS